MGKKSSNDDMWVDRIELQQIDPDILEQYESSSTFNSKEPSSFQPGENDADISLKSPKTWGVY